MTHSCNQGFVVLVWSQSPLKSVNLGESAVPLELEAGDFFVLILQSRLESEDLGSLEKWRILLNWQK